MPISILSAKDMVALENAALSRGQKLSELMLKAIKACNDFVIQRFPLESFPNVAILAGNGHNGADALGVGCELLREGRKVSALLCWQPEHAKELTKNYCAEFQKLGGRLYRCLSIEELKLSNLQEDLGGTCFWIDGLFGFGLNRAAGGLNAALIDFVNQTEKPIISIDIPSGLSCDFGQLNGTHIHATHTLALGALKPAHTDDDLLSTLGEVHWLDLDLLRQRPNILAPNWVAADRSDFHKLISEARRAPNSHKVSNGRLLVIAGSKRYPGAGILTCLGAQISGVGMIHALIPGCAHQTLLTSVPEVILEKKIPNLNTFDAIVVGPGWVPGDAMTFDSVVQHTLKHPEIKLILDAGAFPFVQTYLQKGQSLAENIILTPHGGEFARLFPEPASRINSKHLENKIHRIEAASWAARISCATVVLKGARSAIAHPDGEVFSIMRSSSLLAHAGHGDVLAGLIGGLAAGGLKSKKAALTAALLQAETAYWFSLQYPTALTLPPTELVRQMQHLPLP